MQFLSGWRAFIRICGNWPGTLTTPQYLQTWSDLLSMSQSLLHQNCKCGEIVFILFRRVLEKKKSMKVFKIMTKANGDIMVCGDLILWDFRFLWFPYQSNSFLDPYTYLMCQCGHLLCNQSKRSSVIYHDLAIKGIPTSEGGMNSSMKWSYGMNSIG